MLKKELLSIPQINMRNQLSVSEKDAVKAYNLCHKIDHNQWTNDDFIFIKALRDSYDANQYTEPLFQNKEYFSVMPNLLSKIALIDKVILSNTASDIDSTWDSRRFLCARLPLHISRVEDHDLFDKPSVIRCIHLPIKMPHTDVRIPTEYIQFIQPLQEIFNFERALNKSYSEYYAYLTIDQRFVPKGQYHRLPGAHIDGIPRDTSKPERQKIDHTYIITNNLPTRFFTHQFPLEDFNLQKNNLFSTMRYYADEKCSMLTIPYDIDLINAYSVHTSVKADEDCYRTFFRCEFSVLEFDRKGNSINPYFDYKWKYKECPIPEHLTLPEYILLDDK